MLYTDGVWRYAEIFHMIESRWCARRIWCIALDVRFRFGYIYIWMDSRVYIKMINLVVYKKKRVPFFLPSQALAFLWLYIYTYYNILLPAGNEWGIFQVVFYETAHAFNGICSLLQKEKQWPYRHTHTTYTIWMRATIVTYLVGFYPSSAELYANMALWCLL